MLDPKLKNYLCHILRNISQESPTHTTAFRTEEDVKTFCKQVNEHSCEKCEDHDHEEIAPSVIWAINYKDLPSVRQLGWTIKERKEFV